MAGETKLTVLFQDNRSGWSETYYFQTASETAMSSQADALVAQRKLILGSGAKIIGVRAARYTDVDGIPTVELTRNYRYDITGQAAETTRSASTLQLADSPFTSIVYTFRTSTNRRRTMTLSGVPDNWIVRGGGEEQISFSASGAEKVATFVNYLATAPAMLVRTRLKSGVNAPKPITAINVNTDGRYAITCPDHATLDHGTVVNVTGLKGHNLTNLKGVHKVYERLSTGVHTVNIGPRQDLGDPVYVAGAKLQVVKYGWETAIKGGEALQISSRKRGRPFAQRRGRRSVSR